MQDFDGKKLVLYFYPKDDTPGCTAEACSLRDGYGELLHAGYSIVGVSVDSPKKHLKFIAKYNLPFDLISDEDKSVVTAFGVWGRKKFMGREYDGVYRVTFVIDGSGVITHVIDSVDTKDAAEQILRCQ